MDGNVKELKSFFKRWLMEGTNCGIQHDGWCCRTCLADRIGIEDSLQEGLWHVILSVRGDYDDFDWEKKEAQYSSENHPGQNARTGTAEGRL